MVKALANFEAQAPQGDVVWNVGVTSRAKQNGMHGAQGVEPIGGHHFAMLTVPVATPAKVAEFEAEGFVFGGKCLQDLLAGRHNFFANAITGDACDFVVVHRG